MSWALAHVLNGVLEISSDTLLHCHAIDESENSQPSYLSGLSNS